MAKKAQSAEGGGSALVGLFVLIWLVVKLFWWIVAGLCLVAVFFAVRAMLRGYLRRREAYSDYCARVTARADQQHNWVLQGDDRGVYGVEGAKLMRVIRADRPQLP